MEEMEERKFNRLLKVLFTPPEKIEMSEQIAAAIRNLHKAQDDLATVKAQFQSKIKEHEAEITSLSERINSGWEMRSIGCREIRDYKNGSVYVFRDDTEEIIEERAMTAEERQPTLPFKEKEGELVDADFPTPASAQADAQSEAGERMAALEKPLADLPEDTNRFYVGNEKGKQLGGKDWDV